MPPEEIVKICGAVPIRIVLIIWAVLKTLFAWQSMLLKTPTPELLRHGRSPTQREYNHYVIVLPILLLAAFCSILYILLCIYFLFIEYGVQYNYLLLGILVVLEIALLADFAMSITLIVGESKKNYKIVTAYFRYAIYAVVAAITIIISYTFYELAILWGAEDNAPWRPMRTFKVADVVQLATIGTIYVLFEVFIVYLLRTEVTSLRKQQRMACKSPETDSFMETTN